MKHNRTVIVLTITIFAVLAAVVGMVAFYNLKTNTYSTTSNSEYTDDSTIEKWQEGDVSYKGHTYHYNSGIKTYLFMGIDQDEPVHKSEKYNEGGNCDALFLLVVDSKNDRNSLIAINRNSRTELNIIDEIGKSLTKINGPICIQHGYGDGMRLSCNVTVDAVSRLFHNIPINGYLSFQRGAIPVLNDSIGGVTVTIDDKYTGDSSLVPGETVKLTGSQARSYLVGRAHTKEGATERLDHQMEYINAFLTQGKKYMAGDINKALTIYNQLEEYILTSLDVEKIIQAVDQNGVPQENIYSLKGEIVLASDHVDEGYIQGNGYVEYLIDETFLYELILQVFYEQVN